MKPILHEAHEIVWGDREKTYGDPSKNLETIANFWENYLHARGILDVEGAGLTKEDVCHMMSLLKIARLANNPTHRDSMVDVCGYQALADRIQ